MVFSKSTSYAIRALIYLARQKDKSYILSETIAREEAIPAPFLVKILGTLAAVGIVSSTRGRHGGYALRADLESIKIGSIAALFDPSGPKGDCVLGHGVCGESPDCSVHRLWCGIKGQIDTFLTSTTLADLMRMETAEKSG